MIHNDHLAAPQKMTDASGTVVWSADYKPFGEATVTISTITNNLRFPGQYYDAETGTHYNYYRDYNPAIGRYVETDPIGIKGGMNHPYSYTANNPLTAIDPLGLECEQISPWLPATVISDPNNPGTLIDSYTVKTWSLMGVWNGMPAFFGGKTIKGPCGCTWQKSGYKKISTYAKDVTYQASFKCCTKNKCNDENCKTETKYKDFSQTYTKVENELSIFSFETKVTTGFYLGDGSCSCDDPNLKLY
jgi:RHS repeat-associated protein